MERRDLLKGLAGSAALGAASLGQRQAAAEMNNVESGADIRSYAPVQDGFYLPAERAPPHGDIHAVSSPAELVFPPGRWCSPGTG